MGIELIVKKEVVELKKNTGNAQIIKPNTETLTDTYDKGFNTGKEQGLEQGYDSGFNEGKVIGETTGKFAILDDSEYMHPTVNGSVIAVNDVNDIEHSLAVRVVSKNLLPLTPTRKLKANFNECYFLPKGTYTISMNFANATLWRYTITLYDLNGNLITDTTSDTTHLKGINRVLNYSSGNGGIYQHADNVADNYLTIETDNDYYIGINFYFGNTTADTTVTNPQIELGSIATEYTPYVADVSGVEVSRLGKNLWTGNVIYIQNLKHENGVFTQTFDDAKTRLEFFIQAYMGSTYKKQLLYRYVDDAEIISVSFVKDDTFDRLRIGHSGSDHNVMCMIDISDIPNGTYTIQVNITNATKGNYSWQDIQIELGSTATTYEPYIEPQTAISTADKDGIVNGLTSLSPNMTLLTNSKGTIINCQYYRDIDRYIDNISTNTRKTEEIQQYMEVKTDNVLFE